MTTATDTRESLSAALKTSTAEAHDKAEHSVLPTSSRCKSNPGCSTPRWKTPPAPLLTTRWHLELLTPPWNE